MDTFTNNYVLGRGKLYFDKFQAGTRIKMGERYIGNTPGFTLSRASTALDHFSSDAGLRVKDASVILQDDRSGTFSTDNIDQENMAVLFATDTSTLVTLGSTGEGDTLAARRGRWYQLGERPTLQAGLRNLSNLIMRDNTGAKAAATMTFSGQPSNADTFTINGVATTFVTGAPVASQVQIGGTATLTAQNVLSYINDHTSLFHVVATGAATVITLTAFTAGTAGNAIGLARSGSFPAVSGSFLSGGTNGGVIPGPNNWRLDGLKGRVYIESLAPGIQDGDTVVVNYDVAASTQGFIVETGKEIEGALRYIADNPAGTDSDYYMPYVKLTSDGDFALKGDTWLTMSFKIDVLKLNDATNRFYITT